MTLSNISAVCQVTSRLTGASPAQGGIDTLIAQSVRGESLNSIYTNVITGAVLTATDQVFDNFPAVKLNTVTVKGQDSLPLLLNSIHGIVVQIIQDAGVTSTGFATVTINDIGMDVVTAPAAVHLVAGDALFLTTDRGWPALALSSVTVGATSLTNCNVVISLFGKTAAAATGYGS